MSIILESDYYRCPECGEESYPEACGTEDENPEQRICNGCGLSFEMYEFVNLENSNANQ